MHEIICMIGIHLIYGMEWVWMIDAWTGPRIVIGREDYS
jgi:hypothetical protein